MKYKFRIRIETDVDVTADSRDSAFVLLGAEQFAPYINTSNTTLLEVSEPVFEAVQEETVEVKKTTKKKQ